MKRTKLAVVAISAMVCALAFGSDALARGAGNGQGARLRDGSCVKNQTAVSTQTKTQVKTMQRQRLQDGTVAAPGVTQLGVGQGKMRRLGPGDGTGNVVPPMDGTGYGSPANR